MKDLKVVFMGTPEFALPVLEMLIKNTNVMLVVTQPDKMVGRHKEIKFSPIKELALKNNIEVFQPVRIREDYSRILEVNPDIIITCAYGQIIPKILLDSPRLKCINVHASLLPKLRGGAPLEHAIIDGYEYTGITIMYMDEKMDNGDIIETFKYDINEKDTYKTLSSILSVEGANLLERVLPSIIDGTNKRIKQNEDEVTFAYTIKREEEHIDFTKSVKEVDQLVRGLYDNPLANTIIGDIEYKIVEGHYTYDSSIVNKINVISKKELAIGCSDGLYYIDKIKPAGKNIMEIKSFLNGINIDEFKAKEIK